MSMQINNKGTDKACTDMECHLKKRLGLMSNDPKHQKVTR